MIKRLSSLFIPLLMLSFFMNCTEEKEKIVEVIVKDTVLVEVEVIPVTVDNIDINPDSIAVGGSISLTAETSKEAGVGNLTLYWFANAGTFNKASGDTVVWKAPDDAGTYVITVHATDGNNIGIGKRNIGVGMYAATADVFYVGATACVTCHNAIHQDWSATDHADAWASLQASDHAAPYCNRCHTVDYDEVPGNAGYDDAPIAKFENVQCENCHGPASTHPGANSAVNVDISIDNCITCHSGTHHPFEQDFLMAGHNFDPSTAAHGAPGRAGCNVCHSGDGFIEKYDADFTWEGDPQPVSCAACHDPHETENPYQIRTLDSYTSVVANGESHEIVVTGNGQLCVQCHHARRGPDDQVVPGYSRFGPHSSPQGDMIAGVSAYEDLNGFDFTSNRKTSHYLIKDACVTCHMHSEPYPNANTGHSFVATTAACQDCHGVLESFDDIKAKDDFDGNGLVEGIQTEVRGLLDVLAAELVAAGLDTTGGVAAGLSRTATDTLADGSQKPENIRLRRAGYNYVFVESDASFGVHQPVYTVQLLQQSIYFLNPVGDRIARMHFLHREDHLATNFK